VALDSRTRPTRRPARRRLPLLTALVLLTMAAGCWAWLCVPAAPQAASVSAPRLHTATVQVDTADPAATATAATAVDDTADAIVDAPAGPDSGPRATAPAGPVGSTLDTPVAGDTPVAAGPRAPPAAA
jgi:hypothetical protein